jgi:indolepyruvate ferredoxin oxidoreductase alpha subunit
MEGITPPIIAALVQGFRLAGVGLVTNHPGFHSHCLASSFHGDDTVFSVNERTAFAVAWGAAAGGLRAAVAVKNVGLNDAADAFLNSLMLDICGSLVVVVFDDTDVEQSQLRQDSRHYQAFLGGVWLEPCSPCEAASMAVEAVELSSSFRSPVVLRITNRLLVMEDFTPKIIESRAPLHASFVRDPGALVVHPENYHRHQRQRLIQKQAEWQQWAAVRWLAGQMLARPDASGCIHLVAGSAREPDAPATSLLRLPMLPVPAEEILDATSGARRLKVHEHGDPVVATRLTAQGSSQIQILPIASGCQAPNRQFHQHDAVGGLYRALRALPRPIVVADIGGHTMDPARSADVCLCYGGAVGVAIGLAAACPDHDVTCLTGDGGWFHGGQSAIQEALSRRVRLLVVVLHNGGCKTTGGQAPAASPREETYGGDPFFSEFAEAESFGFHEVHRLAALPGVKILHLLNSP